MNRARGSYLLDFPIAPLLAALLPVIVALAGCAGADRRPEEPRRAPERIGEPGFSPPSFEPPRRLDTIMAADIDGRGPAEYVITSIVDTGMAVPGVRADFVQIYRFDSAARAFRPVVADEVPGAAELLMRDLTGDGVPEIVVRLASGGNDPIASNGMHIYSGAGGGIRSIFQATHGDPQIGDIPGRTGVILLYDELWPSFAAHAEAEAYLSDIFAYRDGRFSSIRRDERKLIMEKADGYLARYRGARDSLAADTLVTYESGMRLFVPAALAIISLQEADAKASLRSFWSSERDFLRSRMLDYQYDELESIYGRAVNA